MSTKFLSPGWRMPRNANQSKSSNYSMNFDGSEYITCNQISKLNSATAFSISVWCKLDNVSGIWGDYVSSIGIKLDWNDYQGGFLQFTTKTTGSNNYLAYNVARDSNWHHIVCTYDAGVRYIYLDGVSVANDSAAPTQMISTLGDNFLIGKHQQPTSMAGQINAVSIFDYALSLSQVTTLYGDSTNGPGNPMALPSPPIAYYPLGTSAWNGEYLAENNAIGDYVFDFDGSNYIATGATLTNLSVSTSFSISCWVKITSNVNFKHIVGAPTSYAAWNTGFGLYTNGSGIRFWVEQYNGANQFVETSSLNTGQWYHISATFDTTNGLKLYVNAGTPTTATGTTIDGLSNTIFIGSTGSNTNYQFVGDLSNTQIWNTELSSTEIETLYNYGSPIQNLANIPQSSNLKAWYKLDASEVYNSSTTEWSIDNNQNPSAYPSSLDFDSASGDYIEVSNNTALQITGDITISAWVYAESDTGRVVSKRGGGGTNYDFFIQSRYLRLYDGVSGPLSTGTINLNEWSHILISVNSGTGTYYINNVVSGTGTFSISPASASQPFYIGGSFTPALAYFNGKLSNVQIFNTALSGSEVETLYNYGSPIKTLANIPQNSNLKAWYKLDASEVYNSSTTEWSIDNNQNPSAYPSSLDFDASSGDYIDCGQNTNLDTGDLSVSIWINKDSAGSGTQYIFNNNNGSSIAGFAILMNSINRVFLYRNTGTYSTNTGYTDVGFTTDTWHHLCFTYNDTTKSFVAYFNGVSFHTSTATSSSGGASQNIIIGTNSGLSGNNFDGQLSNASIWNTELTSAQVTEIYNNGTPSNLSSHSATSNLISWWKLNNTTTGIEDSKGSNDGTNNGAIEYPGFVNVLAGDSSGMSQANLVQSDLQTVAPYSKYALDFDSASSDAITLGNTIGNGFTQITCSIWANISTSGLTQSSYRNFLVKFPGGSGSATPFELRSAPGNRTDSYNNKLFFRVNTNTGGYGFTDTGFEFTEANKWHHLVGTYDGSNVKLFVDGVEYYSISASGTLNSNNNNATIGYYGSTGNFNGKLSNASIWNTALTSAQVTEIYNEGLPGNLNSHSAYSNLVSWWQLGENSSFDGNDWIVADEKGTNNGTSTGMSVGALVNGVGTTANGLSSGMSEGNLVGDAPYSTANALSTNMVVTSRVSGSGNTP